MGTIQLPLHEALSGLSGALRCVDLRVAAYRGRVSQPTDDSWRLLRAVVRVSFKDHKTLQDEYTALEQTVGAARTDEFVMFHDVIALSDLPRLEQGHGIAVGITDNRIHVSSTPLDRDPMARVSRYPERGGPVRGEAPPRMEYFYLLPFSQAPVINFAYLDAYVRRELGVTSATALMNKHLQLSENSSQPGMMCVQIEMPAVIEEPRLLGSALELRVQADVGLGDVRLFVTTFASGGVGIATHQPVQLRQTAVDGAVRTLRGEAQVRDVDPDAIVECVLTHSRIPELDDFRRRLRDLTPLTERNPLLVCLQRFWNLTELARRLEKPYLTLARRADLTPQGAFQAAVAHVLTLAGFQALDLGSEEHIRDPNTRVEIATADLLAYHAPTKILLVGACTINVPKGEDYDRLLHVAAILGEQFEDRSSINIIPALFTGQEPDSVLLEQATLRRLRIFTRNELCRLLELVEEGQEQRLLRFLTFPTAEL